MGSGPVGNIGQFLEKILKQVKNLPNTQNTEQSSGVQQTEIKNADEVSIHTSVNPKNSSGGAGGGDQITLTNSRNLDIPNVDPKEIADMQAMIDSINTEDIPAEDTVQNGGKADGASAQTVKTGDNAAPENTGEPDGAASKGQETRPAGAAAAQPMQGSGLTLADLEGKSPEELRQIISDDNTVLREKKNELTNIMSGVNPNNEQIARAKQNLETTVKEQAQNAAAKTETENEKADNTKELDSAKSANRTTNTKRTRKESEIKSITDKISTLKKTIDGLEAALAAAEAAGLFDGGASAAAIRAQLEAVKRVLQTTEAALKASQGDLSGIMAELGDQESLISDLTDAIAGGDNILSQLTRQGMELYQKYQQGENALRLAETAGKALLGSQINVTGQHKDEAERRLNGDQTNNNPAVQPGTQPLTGAAVQPETAAAPVQNETAGGETASASETAPAGSGKTENTDGNTAGNIPGNTAGNNPAPLDTDIRQPRTPKITNPAV